MADHVAKQFTISRAELARLGVDARVGQRFISDYFELFPVLFEIVKLDGELATVLRIARAKPKPVEKSGDREA